MNQLKDKGVDTVAVVSVNDAFVMANWAKSLSAGEILMLADGNGDFAKILGMQKDCHAAGMGTRSLRYALIIKHGIVKYVGVDKSGLEKSSVESTKLMVSGVHFDFQEIFNRFELDPVYGFVTCLERADRKLPAKFAAWEDIVANLTALATSGRLRGIIEQLPELDCSDILNDRLACERAHAILSFIAHSYVRGRLHDKALSRLPKGLANPWIKVSEAIGVPPIVTYAGTVLFNFRPIDPNEPLHLDGSIDETWFFIVSLAIDCHSGNLLRLFIDIQNASANADYQLIESLLLKVAEIIGEIEKILVRMYDDNIPAVFYQRIRRYLSGWLNNEDLPEGVYYGDEDEPRLYAGGSAAQSPTIQVLDIALGVSHRGKEHDDSVAGVNSAGSYLLEMRNYMTQNHRGLLAWLEENICVRDIVNLPGVPEGVKTAFNQCLSELRSFRDKHLAIVSNYIIVQSQKSNKENAVKGTGGSNPIQFLKEVRSHMDSLPL